MSRCGCEQSGCSCAIVSGDGITLTGNGSGEAPYTIATCLSESPNNAISYDAEGCLFVPDVSTSSLHYIRVLTASNQSIPNGADTTVDLVGSTNLEANGMTRNISDINVVSKGRYVVGACIRWAGNSVGRRILMLKVNGTVEIVRQEMFAAASGGWSPTMVVETTRIFNAGDFITAVVHQTSGAALNIERFSEFTGVIHAQQVMVLP